MKRLDLKQKVLQLGLACLTIIMLATTVQADLGGTQTSGVIKVFKPNDEVDVLLPATIRFTPFSTGSRFGKMTLTLGDGVREYTGNYVEWVDSKGRDRFKVSELDSMDLPEITRDPFMLKSLTLQGTKTASGNLAGSMTLNIGLKLRPDQSGIDRKITYLFVPTN